MAPVASGSRMTRLGPSARLRERVAQGFTTVEDILYVGLGVMLAVTEMALLDNAAVHFARSLASGRGGSARVVIIRCIYGGMRSSRKAIAS